MLQRERDTRGKQFDEKRDREKGKQAHVETHTENKLQFSRPGWREKNERWTRSVETTHAWMVTNVRSRSARCLRKRETRIEACVFLLLLLLWSVLTSSIVFFFFPSFLASFYSLDREIDSEFIHWDQGLNAVASLHESPGEAPNGWFAWAEHRHL